MNKLNKDQIQKIILSSLLMIGLIYCYFTFLIDPLSRGELSNANTINDLNTRIGQAKGATLRSHSLQEQARTADETLAQVSDLIPDGAPIAWFPPRMTAFFDRHNLKGAVIRSSGADPAGDPALQNLKNATWTIELPQAGVTALGIAIAGLENEEKLLEITRLQIATQPDSPEKQHVSMNVTTLLK